MEPASSEAKRAGRIGGHHTAGLIGNQAALSLVDRFSWVSRCSRAVSLSALRKEMAFVSCARSFVRSFVVRSLARSCIVGSLLVAVTKRLDRVMKGWLSTLPPSSHPFSFVFLHSAPGYVGSCMLHDAEDDRNASAASHARVV